jgi:hypothetical protein
MSVTGHCTASKGDLRDKQDVWRGDSVVFSSSDTIRS